MSSPFGIRGIARVEDPWQPPSSEGSGAVRLPRQGLAISRMGGHCEARRAVATSQLSSLGIRGIASVAFAPSQLACSACQEADDPFALIDRVAQGHLVRLGPFEVEVDVVFPGEAGPAQHLDGACRGVPVDLGAVGFRHG